MDQRDNILSFVALDSLFSCVFLATLPSSQMKVTRDQILRAK